MTVPDDHSSDLTATFRAKATMMKSWKPASTPSNRDRLELYALHKQAVSGDAPPSLVTSSVNSTSPGEQAKYQAWRSKRGIHSAEAMRLYLSECDRQMRVYGTSPMVGGLALDTTTTSTSSSEQQQQQQQVSNPQDQQQQQQSQQQQQQHSDAASRSLSPGAPRGLAAIPLLCAAASERRLPYLRRLSHTTVETSWWSRQEALCATPGTLGSLPETLLIGMASLIEYVSLTASSPSWWILQVVPTTTVQSWLWPLHNCCLSLWMALILWLTLWGAAWSMVQTLLWGARRTGLSLSMVLVDEVQATAAAIDTLQQPHQPLTARLVGLALWPFTWLAAGTKRVRSSAGVVVASIVHVALLMISWWYWWLWCPWLAMCLMAMALLAGGCFALIDLANL